jgi:hypothetical protein
LANEIKSDRENLRSNTLRDAIVFFGRAVDDFSVVKPSANDGQPTNFGPEDFADFAFYTARFGRDGAAPAILKALNHPATATRLGGCTTLMAGKYKELRPSPLPLEQRWKPRVGSPGRVHWISQMESRRLPFWFPASAIPCERVYISLIYR